MRLFRHYKGGLYMIEGLVTMAGGRDEGEKVVVYSSLHNGEKWARLLYDFLFPNVIVSNYMYLGPTLVAVKRFSPVNEAAHKWLEEVGK